MTISQLLRQRMMERAGIDVHAHNNSPDEVAKDIADKVSTSNEVFAMAKDRLKVGTYRYGVSNHDRYDYRMRLQQKLALYDETGNKEYLVDVVNYAVLEFGYTSREDTYFSIDDDNTTSIRGYDK